MSVLTPRETAWRKIKVPETAIDASLQRPGTSHLVVTHCGHWPVASGHYEERPNGLPDAMITVCVEGNGWYEIAGRVHRLGPGQLIVMAPNVPYTFGNDTDQTWNVWWLHATGPDIPELLRASGVTSEEGMRVREINDPYRIVVLFDEMMRVITDGFTEPSMLAASGAAWHLFALLLATSRAAGDIISPVDRARDYLLDHFDEALTVEDLARLSNLSPSHFAAVFRRRYGVPVLAYQTQLRMARARELLDSTDSLVGEIARIVGYVDPSTFTRRFTVSNGVSPRAYRAQKVERSSSH